MSSSHDGGGDPAVLEEVRALLQLFNHAVTAMKLFPPGHPNTIRFRAEFLEQLQGFLKAGGPFEVAVEDTVFRFGGEVVYQDDNVHKSLPYLFFKDGIQTLRFQADITEKELGEFLDIVREASLGANDEVDIALALWEREFQSIEYVVPDDFLESKIPIRTKKPFDFDVDSSLLYSGRIDLKPDDREDIDKRSRAIAAKEKSEMLDLAQLITSFDERDRGTIKALLSDERSVPVEQEFIEALCEILTLEERPNAYTGILGFVESYLGELTQQGKFIHAERLLNRLEELLSQVRVSAPPKVQMLTRLLGQVRENAPLAALAEQFRQGRVDSIAAFFRYLEAIGPRTIALGADLFDSVQDGEARSEAYAFTKSLGLRHPDILIDQAGDSRPFLSKSIIRLFVEANDRRFLPNLARFQASEDPAVRREAVRGLSRFDDSLADKLLLPFLRDESEAVRIAAAEGLHPRPDPAFIRQVAEIIEDRSFNEKSRVEKAALLSYLGRTGTPAALDILRRLLTRTRLGHLAKARKAETRLAAVQGLESMSTDAAVEALRKGAAGRGTVAAACRTALERLGRPQTGELR